VNAAPADIPRRSTASLRRRLLLWLMVPVLAAVPLLGYGLYRFVHDTAIVWLDQSLGDTALALVSLIREQDGRLSLDISNETDRALRFDRDDHIDVLVLDPQGRVLHGEPQLRAVADALPAPIKGQWHFADARLGTEPVRVVQVTVACGGGQDCQVVVAETLHKRDQLRSQVLVGVAVAISTLGALLLLGCGFAIRQGLLPLERLGGEIERRNLDRLEPLDTAVPAELSPLIAAFNRLFARLRQATAAQSEFLADAAHQLRTPLTSLQTEIDLALLEPHDATAEPLLRRLQRSVERSARLATQLLSIARAESDLGQPMRRLDLRDVAAQVAEDWVPRALDQNVDLGFELQTAPVEGQGFLLREMLENLVHNSVHHAGPGTRVTVRTFCDGGRAVLEVEDNGPGIAPDERARAVRRFHRGADAGGQGSGLGLAIASDIARRHGGRLELLDASHGQGLRVRLTMTRNANAGLA
jgi:two-component system sensor histidine kinase TctE